MSKNIKNIEDFILSDKKTLIINQVNDEIGMFYEFAIKQLSIKYKKKIISKKIDDEIDYSDDLFGNENIYVYILTNNKQIDFLSNEKFQKIIITDYKIYKKFRNNFVSVNGYDFENDIQFLLVDYLKISNRNLVNYCKEHPYFTYSEITKYEINNKDYFTDPSLNNPNNFILDIRKNIYNMKGSQLNVKNLYLNIKSEAKYKKLNFLTF